MTSKLIRNARLVAVMDDAGTEIADGAILIEDARIRQVGPTGALPDTADEIIDATGMVIMPGLVNTHHHFFQTLTRTIPAAQNANLFAWLQTLYPIWAGMTPEAIQVSTKIALAELLLSGCTTASDHTYIWPNGSRIDDQIEAAIDMGVRFHASRGSMSVGESKGGLPPDRVVEDEDAILRDSRRAIETYHDPRPGAMIRIALAPCSPFSVSPDLMRESVALARAHGVHSHTHLAETRDEAEFCQRTLADLRSSSARTSPGSEKTSGTRISCIRATTRSCASASREQAPRIARPRTCGSPPGSRRLAHGSMPGCGSGSVSMGRPRTTDRICWPRRGWQCCFNAPVGTRKR